MKITSVDTILLAIPFEDGGKGEGLAPTRWNQLDILLVRIETDNGLVGWGEGFGYFVAKATKHIVDHMIAPILVGMEIDDPAVISDLLQRKLALFGRHGITMFAISGVDIALWDLVAKAAAQPLADYLGGAKTKNLKAYASLVRYGDAATAEHFTRKAVSDGYPAIKLHEIELPEILACRTAAPDVDMTVDVNCNWSSDTAKRDIPVLKDHGIVWLEEPTFPPEDFHAMAALNQLMPIAAGENLCTSHPFKALIDAGAVRYLQPSVTKVGGITEFLKIANMAQAAGLKLMPHSPYFGPGYHATLHLCAARAPEALFEHLYIWPDALPDPQTPLPLNGSVSVPIGDGLGFTPSRDVISKYRVA